MKRPYGDSQLVIIGCILIPPLMKQSDREEQRSFERRSAHAIHPNFCRLHNSLMCSRVPATGGPAPMMEGTTQLFLVQPPPHLGSWPPPMMKRHCSQNSKVVQRLAETEDGGLPEVFDVRPGARPNSNNCKNRDRFFWSNCTEISLVESVLHQFWRLCG